MYSTRAGGLLSRVAETIGPNLRECAPRFVGVPRIFEKIYAGLRNAG